MSAPPANDTTPALLFVPDISGFTQFVQVTEIAHSRHIIEELLEKLIEANDLGLQVSEVEGDAILFYRFGPPPTAAAFFQQVQKMFVAYHSHLRLYETQRICRCGACVSAQNLTLKIVAHYGHITQSHIKEHVKLFGQDVITVHRLLKNDIAHHEYALFTQALVSEWPEATSPAWAQRKEGAQDYDVGRITYGYVPLAPLRQLVPEPRSEDFSIPGVTVHVFSCEQVVHAPLRLVFAIASDLPLRLRWMQGVKDVEMLNDQFNRLGTKHRCVVDKHSPIMVTSGSTHTDDTITLAETNDKKTMCSVYTLQRESEAQTRVRIDGFLKDNFVLRILFTLLLKKKLTHWFQTSSENLKHLCQEIYNTQRT
jgi:hypothetical protein